MLLSCGDALIDFVPARTADGREAYIPAVGGSCLNVAVAMARLGAPAGFVGGISTDLFGVTVAAHAEASGVSLRYAERPASTTTLAFVRFADGEPAYAFYDEATATQRWTYRPGTIPFDDVDALHVGSTSLIRDPASGEALAMIREARARTVVSFDPNCRPTLVADKADYLRRMEAFAAQADVVRMSDVDFAYLFSSDDHSGYAQAALARGASLVVITKGAKGAQAWCRSGTVEVPGAEVAVVDTIAAGDTFQGALLVALREAGRLGRGALSALPREGLGHVLTFAVVCAGIACSRPGADPPFRHEIATLPSPA